MTTLNTSYSDDLQTYTYQKHVLDICFKANKIHLKMDVSFSGQYILSLEFCNGYRMDQIGLLIVYIDH